MNIFVLDYDPAIAAQMQCDKHVVKMILESAQMLSTVQQLNGLSSKYKPTHAKHPCTVWAGKTLANYTWLLNHGMALCKEYTKRYGKIHKCQSMFEGTLCHVPKAITERNITTFAQAMPDQYRQENTVEAYRRYYIHEKAAIAKWKHSNVPNWFTTGIQQKETHNVG